MSNWTKIWSKISPRTKSQTESLSYKLALNLETNEFCRVTNQDACHRVLDSSESSEKFSTELVLEQTWFWIRLPIMLGVKSPQSVLRPAGTCGAGNPTVTMLILLLCVSRSRSPGRRDRRAISSDQRRENRERQRQHRSGGGSRQPWRRSRSR